MPNVSVVSSGNSIEVVFGDYGQHPDINSKCRSYDNRDIAEIDLVFDESHLVVMMKTTHGKNVWYLTWNQNYSGTEYFIIDTVDQTPPTSQHDLLLKLQALRG